MSRAHQQSQLPAQDMAQIIDGSTDELFHYDISPNGVNGTKPTDDIYDDSLICWLEMQNQNSAGTYVVDKSRYGRHGKLNGPTICSGRRGKALSFSTDDYIDCGMISLPSNAITLEVWIKFNAVTSNQYFFGNYDSSGKWVMIWASTSTLFFAVDDGVTKQDSTYPGLVVGQWYHIIGTFDGTNQKLYVNGVQAGSTVTGTYTSIVSTNRLIIGKDASANSSYLNGAIDEVRVYNRALSVDEVTSRYNQSIYTISTNSKYGSAIEVEETTINYMPSAMADCSGPFEQQSLSGGTFQYSQLTDVDGRPHVTRVYSSSRTGYAIIGWNDMFTAAIGDTYTFSFEYKVLQGSESPSFSTVYADGYKLPDATNVATFDSPIITDMGNGWQRYSRTFTVKTVGNTWLRINYYANTDTDTEVLLDNFQVEKKTFATSFVNGAREEGRLIYPTINAPTGKTISAWFYVDNIAMNTDRYVFSYDNMDDTDNMLALYLSRNNAWTVLSGYDYRNTSTLAVNNTLTAGYHHFAVTISASLIALYIDGKLAGSLSNPKLPTNIQYMRIGNGNRQNLVTNGNAELGNNTNFSSFVYATSDSSDGDGMCFTKTSGGSTVLSDTYIPVDYNKLYELKGSLKAVDVSSHLYFGVACYDKDKNFINYNMVNNTINTRTMLAQDLKTGDTTVYLTSAANWYLGTAGVYVHNKQIALWPSSWSYPPYTYTRTTAHYLTCDTTANTLTLETAWTGSTITAGTPVANCSDGSGYNYIAASNALVPLTWAQYKATITDWGVSNDNKFRYGTKYIRILFLMNRDYGTVTTAIDDIQFRELSGSCANTPIDELRIDNTIKTEDEIRSWYLSNCPFFPRGNERVVL